MTYMMELSDDDMIPVKDSNRSSYVSKTYVSRQNKFGSDGPQEELFLSELSKDELKSRYVKARDELIFQKKLTLDQEAVIKQLNTKFQKIITDKKKIGDKENISLLLEAAKNKELLDKQMLTIEKLRKQNEMFERKLKVTSLQLKSQRSRREPHAFQNIPSKVDTGLKNCHKILVNFTGRARSRNKNKAIVNRSHSSPPVIRSRDSSPASVSTETQKVLIEARERIIALEEEKENLKEQLTEALQCAAEHEDLQQQQINELEDELYHLREDLHESKIREERDCLGIISAQREKSSQAVQVLELNKIVAKLEDELNSVNKLRGDGEAQLFSLKEEHNESLSKIQFLSLENKRLEKEEERLKVMHQNIVENSSFENEIHAITDKLLRGERKYEKEERLKHMQFTNRISELESELQVCVKEKEDCAIQFERMQKETRLLERERSNFREDALRLTEEVHHLNGLLNQSSLKIEKQQKLELEVAEKFKVPSGEGAVFVTSDRNYEKLKEKYTELQILYKEKTLELNKISSLLESHAETYNALQSECLTLQEKCAQKDKVYEGTIKEIEKAKKWQEEKYGKLEKQSLSNAKIGQESSSCTLTLYKKDSALDFCIYSIHFTSAIFTELKTFVSWTMPFNIEDPLQYTNCIIGSEAIYDHTAIYKIKMDQRNILTLRDYVLKVGVYILLSSNKPVKIGECAISFQELLLHPRNTLHGTVEVYSYSGEAEELPIDFQNILSAEATIGILTYKFNLLKTSEKVINQALFSEIKLQKQLEEVKLSKSENMELHSCLQKSAVEQPIYVPSNISNTPDDENKDLSLSKQNSIIKPSIRSVSSSTPSDYVFKDQNRDSDVRISKSPGKAHSPLKSFHDKNEKKEKEQFSEKMPTVETEKEESSYLSKEDDECSSSATCKQVPSLEKSDVESDSVEESEADKNCNNTEDSESVASTESEQSSRTESNASNDNCNTIYMTVHSLLLLSGSKVIEDPQYQCLFIDYHGFLKLPPQQLETPESVPKPLPNEEAMFDFSQNFSVDPSLYPERRNALIYMLESGTNLKFTIASEPPPDLDDQQDCVDIGYAYINLQKLLEEGVDMEREKLSIYDADEGSLIGYIKISLQIISVLSHLKAKKV